MAAAPTREGTEKAIAIALLLMFDDEEGRINGGRRFDAGDFAERTAPQLVEPLAAGFRAAGRRLMVQHGLEGDGDLVARSNRWATRRARTLSREIATTTRDRLGDADPDADDFEDTVADILGRERADVVGATETTSAYSAGQYGAADEYKATTGKVLVPRWVTERDEAVCPICEPLDGTTRRVWGRRYAFGPPAHPRCRCDLSWS